MSNQRVSDIMIVGSLLGHKFAHVDNCLCFGLDNYNTLYVVNLLDVEG